MSTCLDNTYDALAWGSHLPALLAAVAASDGPVLELGVGHFSTPALHALCGALHKRLISVEDDPKWLELFANRFSDGGAHRFISGPYDQSVPDLIEDERNFGVAFIDNSPGGSRRARDFELLLPHSSYAVVHDYHRENEEAIRHLFPTAGVILHVTKLYEPPTLIASMYWGIPASILCL